MFNYYLFLRIVLLMVASLCLLRIGSSVLDMLSRKKGHFEAGSDRIGNHRLDVYDLLSTAFGRPSTNRRLIGERVFGIVPPGILKFFLNIENNYLRKNAASSFSQDLFVCESNYSQFTYDVIVCELAGALVLFLIIFIDQLLQLHLSPFLLILIAFLIVFVSTISPYVYLRNEAQKRRYQIEENLCTLLDLMSLCLSGGMGIEEAINAVGSASGCKEFVMLRKACNLALQQGKPTYVGFKLLYDVTGVSSLNEIYSNLTLSGQEGARIRTTILQKSKSLRSLVLARELERANAVTEKMFFPSTLLMIGFLIFVGYPAISQIFRGM